MAVYSAGIVAFRISDVDYEILLVHPVGPFWAKKDANAWSIPKGEFIPPEDAFIAAKREFTEETGLEIGGTFFELEPAKQPGGKIIYSWAVETDLDVSEIRSNTFTLEWPPKSGKFGEFPEADKAAWFSFKIAKTKMHKGQIVIVEKLAKKLGIQI